MVVSAVTADGQAALTSRNPTNIVRIGMIVYSSPLYVCPLFAKSVLHDLASKFDIVENSLYICHRIL